MMFFWEVFLQFEDKSCYVSVSFYLLGSKELIVLFSPFVNFSVALSLPGTLVSVMEAVPVCFRQHCVDKVHANFCVWLLLRHIVEDTE